MRGTFTDSFFAKILKMVTPGKIVHQTPIVFNVHLSPPFPPPSTPSSHNFPNITASLACTSEKRNMLSLGYVLTEGPTLQNELRIHGYGLFVVFAMNSMKHTSALLNNVPWRSFKNSNSQQGTVQTSYEEWKHIQHCLCFKASFEMSKLLLHAASTVNFFGT